MEELVWLVGVLLVELSAPKQTDGMKAQRVKIDTVLRTGRDCIPTLISQICMMIEAISNFCLN